MQPKDHMSMADEYLEEGQLEAPPTIGVKTYGKPRRTSGDR